MLVSKLSKRTKVESLSPKLKLTERGIIPT